MKRLTCLVFLLISTFFVVAQQPEFLYGINGGPVFSRFKVDRGYDFGNNVDYITGYHTALLLKMDLSSGVFFETQLGLCEQGYNENQEDVLDDGYFYTFEDSYMGYEFEDRYRFLNNMWFVGYTYNLSDKFDISSSIGCYWGYLVGGNSKSRNYYYVTAEDAAIMEDPYFLVGYNEKINKEPLKRAYYKDFDYGLGGRVSLAYKISSRMALRLSGGYRHGLSNILKPNDGWLEKYTRSFNLTAGVVVGF